jgi:hypothetical protein
MATLARMSRLGSMGLGLWIAAAAASPLDDAGKSFKDSRPDAALMRVAQRDSSKRSASARRSGRRSATAEGRVAGPPRAVWVGQDGHDRVGPNSALAGSDVQDIHIKLINLPPQRQIVHLVIRGLGSDEWQFNGPNGPWRADLQRTEGATTADVFVEPSKVETGRPFTVTLQFDDGQTIEFTFPGGRADPNLRMPSAAVQARWVGQDRHDRVGAGPSVGPDGFQDAHISLTKLSPKVEVRSVTIEGPRGLVWQFGVNPKGLPNAELIRRGDDSSRADLFLDPLRDLKGQTLKLTIHYANDKIDTATVVAGRTDPKLRMPQPSPLAFSPIKLKTRWLGQEGGGSVLGDVRIALEGLPSGRTIVAAALSDAVRGCWVDRSSDRIPFDAGPDPGPLTFCRTSPTTAELSFAPERDETGTTMTLRLLFEDGKQAFAQFPGGSCDPDRRAPALVSSSPVVARPGDDLQAMANRSTRIRLTKGTYRLNRPLVLERSIAIAGEPGAVLSFTQAAHDAPWTAAIKIHAAHTKLEGFAVRFTGPIRWNRDVQYGPAVIGTTDNLDGRANDLKVGLVFSHLDLEGPPASNPGTWEEAPHLLRLMTARSGRIVGNTLKGGMIAIGGGPWKIVENDYRGTPPWTFCHAVISCSWSHDLEVKGNRAKPDTSSGKTWRFLVLTQSGVHDVVRDNVIEAIGPRDGDTIPNMNAPEIILTEAYRLHFEGRPSAVSADGRIMQIPPPQGDPARTGDVVAVLAGPNTGHWRRITQALGPTAYLLDEPLPSGAEVIAIATGFVDEIFAGNTIDCRGGEVAAPLVLVGNHYGTKVTGNHILATGESFRITAAPTEKPGPWGWSHAPFLGGVIEGNTIEDTIRGATLAVEHGPPIKSNKGRVYMTVTLKDNLARWSETLRSRRLQKGAKGEVAAIKIGDPGSLDPGELVVISENNRAESIRGDRSAAVLRVHAAIINGKAIVDRSIPLPAPATAAASHAEPLR